MKESPLPVKSLQHCMTVKQGVLDSTFKIQNSRGKHMLHLQELGFTET